MNIDILDNTGALPEVVNNYKVNKEALGLRLKMQDTIMYYAHNVSLINESHATSCDERYIPMHYIKFFNIKTLQDYSPQYPADSDITALFRARELENTDSIYSTVNEIILKINKGYDKRLSYNTFDLYLLDTTAFVGEHRFEIEMTMSDGAVISRATETIMLY